MNLSVRRLQAASIPAHPAIPITTGQSSPPTVPGMAPSRHGAPSITISLHRKPQPKIMALDKPGNRDEQDEAGTNRNRQGVQEGRDGAGVGGARIMIYSDHS
ncbi:hypothetical protein NDS46_25460 [Paenibacillus thiaminolyticus]|uniref:hypothetical protein n=1 Tax=Paenibacillus thiaminolyticus TaxID=49283 RepID=UPI00232ED39D|nr:hypothetical protein [Paenibacillus thiaminolyticus]WCF07616.1 hypothetical protein NDS46_25460 [Paenibacillus thiaminolyticus]